MPFRHWRLSGHSINQIGNAEEVTWVRPTDNGIAHGDHCRDYDVLDNELHSGCQSLYPGNDRDGQRRCFYCNRFGFALATLLLAFMAKLPFAQAPSMALNAYFAFTLVQGMGYSWQTAMTAMFVEGVIFILITFLNVREVILNSIPMNLRFAISAGIGMFIAFVGLKNAGIIVPNPATFVMFGPFTPVSILAMVGILLSGILRWIWQSSSLPCCL